MVKTLTGTELLSLYQRKKLLHRLVRWNPEYVKNRKASWLRSSTPPQEPLELAKVYTLTNKYGKSTYVLRLLCSDKTCGCRDGKAKHPWTLSEDGLAHPNNENNPHPVFAKHGAFIIGP